MTRFIIVYHKRIKRGNGKSIDYPVHKEYFFGEGHYAEILDRWIPSSLALAEYRLLNTDYDRAKIYGFRLENHDNNMTDPYCCFYLTCLGTNPHKLPKLQYQKFRAIGVGGVIFTNNVLKGQSTPYFQDFSFNSFN